jgi:hypothetical protein
MRACVVACAIDTVYQLIYSSAQTRAWRIEFSYTAVEIFTHIRRDELGTPWYGAFSA